jgi:hypothetical protein
MCRDGGRNRLALRADRQFWREFGPRCPGPALYPCGAHRREFYFESLASDRGRRLVIQLDRSA